MRQITVDRVHSKALAVNLSFCNGQFEGSKENRKCDVSVRTSGVNRLSLMGCGGAWGYQSRFRPGRLRREDQKAILLSRLVQVIISILSSDSA